MSWIKLQPKPDFHALFITADQRFCMRSLGMWRTVSLLDQSSSCIFSPASTQNSAVFPNWTWSSSKNWPQEWLRIQKVTLLLAGNRTPNAPHKFSQLWLTWRAAPVPALEKLFGIQMVLVPVPASPAVRTVRAWITWNPPGWVGMPWASGTCQSHIPAQEKPVGTLQSCSVPHALWQCRRESLSPFPLGSCAPRNRALLPPCRQVLSPAMLLFFGCYFRCVIIHWCSS